MVGEKLPWVGEGQGGLPGGHEAWTGPCCLGGSSVDGVSGSGNSMCKGPGVRAQLSPEGLVKAREGGGLERCGEAGGPGGCGNDFGLSKW